MKINLLTKYIILYIAIALVSFFAVTVVCYRIDYQNVYDEQADILYRQAASIAKEYTTEFGTPENMRDDIRELRTVARINDTRIMFIDTSGNVYMDTDYMGTANEEGIYYTIDNFNYDSLNTSDSIYGKFFNYFSENHLSAVAPIAGEFSLKGFAIVHMPASVLNNRVYTTFETNYYSLMIVFWLNISFIIVHFIYVHRPIKDISKAITEYGKGNLAYRVKAHHQDEIGRLAASLDYMASELNESEQFQQKFLSNISHDFRSPLTSIKGYLEAIADGTVPPEMINKYINIILFETDRLTKLTSNILTLNELDPKTVRLEQTNFDINPIIKHTIESFEGTCKKKRIQFQLTFSGESAYVYADKGKIQQVIYNLIDNAIKFSNENSFVSVILREKGEKLYVSVKDSGCGIPKDSLDKIWDRFYKTDSSRGRDKKGSGLGLSITKEIIQAHSETIDVISTEGVGTEFIFSLTLGKNV
ncbi:MAG: HAMP domain-containing protein [Lachnospira sp.]|nr:HAMP domain-containing protein [Lachnospira sp.]